MVSNHDTLALRSAREKLTKLWETKPPEVDNDHLERVHSATLNFFIVRIWDGRMPKQQHIFSLFLDSVLEKWSGKCLSAIVYSLLQEYPFGAVPAHDVPEQLLSDGPLPWNPANL